MWWGGTSATVSFIKRKIKGFCPNFYVAWIVAFIVENYVRWNGSFVNVIKNVVNSIYELLFLTEAGFAGSGAFRANTVTWYISAMLLVMVVYYPLLIHKKTRKPFLSIIAPGIFIFIYGYAFSNFKAGFGGPSIYVGIMMKGLMRGFAEIAVGCFVFELASKLKKLQASRLFRSLLSVIAAGCYVFVFWGANLESSISLNTIMMLAIALGVTISFSGQTLWSDCLNKPVISWLGIFSFDLYLSHGFWSHAMRKIFPVMSYKKLLFIYMLLAIVTALVVYWISKIILKVWPLVTSRIRTLMISEEYTELKKQGE